MRILLDTQVFLWLKAEPERLSKTTLEQLSDEANEVLLSAASAWEIGIKCALGKLTLPGAPSIYVPRRMAQSKIAGLPITHPHALRAGELPPHHRDPFDRLLVAQAQIERLALLTADAQLHAYDVRTLTCQPPPAP